MQYRVNFQENYGHALYLGVAGILLYGCFTEQVETPTPTPTPTISCPKITWEVLNASDNQWSLRSMSADVLVNIDALNLCIPDFVYSQQCASNAYAQLERNWFNGDPDIRNIKYIDCDGNEFEAQNIEYRTYGRECGTYDATGATGVDFKFCFYLGTPTPTQEELPSSISPSMWTDDEMLAQFNSSALPKYCAISMYAKDGKYYIASGTNKVGEPQSFEKAPIINWNLCDECVDQDHTQVFLSINVYENEEAANLACVDDINGICSRSHINPTSYSHPP